MNDNTSSRDRCASSAWLAVLAITALLALGACNAVAGTPYATTAPPSSTVAPSGAPVVVPAALLGTWTADVQGTTASSGTWTLVVAANNLTLHNPVGGDPFTLDPIAITTTSMVLPADSGCPDQTTVTSGTYTLTLTGNTLVITGSDSCGDRRAVLTTAPWLRHP